ncbi:trypsin-7-like [Bradysia coprophila]|uniref:trypsin-7-like n=1 Tax=Bradysia coprophila TaxID=38358 RepID=UPI00187DA16B|nr:trypsin-7-like [Bradysia coprophila]
MKSLLILVAVAFNVVEFALSSSSNVTFITKQTDSRIVGGYPIPIERAPWIVQLNYRNNYICAGSIISSTKILSAAHCTTLHNANLFTVRAGTTLYNEGGQVRSVWKTIEHPEYSRNNVANDISILFLEAPLQLSSRIAIIDINENPSVLSHGTEVTSSGWGLLCENCSSPSKNLQEVKLPTVDNEQCRQIYKENANILPSMFCCGLKSGGKDACKGDSGGPITLGNSLVGIVSFGMGCARPNVPGVYTRVSYFSNWIKTYL